MPHTNKNIIEQARCRKEQEETARVEAVHARMEEEYRVALTSSERERARFEEVIAGLEGVLKDERHAQAIRYKCCAELLWAERLREPDVTLTSADSFVSNT